MSKIEMVKVSELKFAKFQPEQRTEEHRLKYLRQSMERYGFIDAFPIVIDSDRNIADGHKRVTVALSLGMDKIPAIVVDDEFSLDDLWGIQTTAQSPNATEVMDAYSKGLKHIPEKHKTAIMLLQNSLGGKAALKSLMSKGKFSPAIYYRGKQIANYCGRGDDTQFVCQTLIWIVELKMQHQCRTALEYDIDPELLVAAIQEMRPISLVANLK